MRNFLAAVLSVLTAGVMVIAYALINPRMATADMSPSARPVFASDRVGLIEDGYAPYSPYASASPRPEIAYPASAVRAIAVSETYPAPELRRVTTSGATPIRSSRVERAPGRDWTKTAMVIGGSTAAGAGLGAIFGGKKGALIGAALGGGASTIYEVRKK
jgi:hypothetical protein